MNIPKDTKSIGTRNKDVWHVGFAKYKQIGRYFSEVEKNMQNGWFLLPVGDATQTEEENLTAAGRMQQDLLSLQFAHIPLLAVYESSISQENGGQNGEPTLRKETFLMIRRSPGCTNVSQEKALEGTYLSGCRRLSNFG